MYNAFLDPNMLFMLFAFYCVYYLEIFQSTQNAIAIKYRKVQSLVNLVRTQYKNIFMIIWVCTCIVVKNTYINLCQKLNRSVVRVDKNTYEVTYVINGVQYKMHVQAKKGPKILIQALDQDDKDITETIQSYLGPMENFHGHAYTPKFFGTNEVTLNLSSGKDLTFKDSEQIKL